MRDTTDPLRDLVLDQVQEELVGDGDGVVLKAENSSASLPPQALNPTTLTMAAAAANMRNTVFARGVAA